jgi:hypothetical protein
MLGPVRTSVRRMVILVLCVASAACVGPVRELRPMPRDALAGAGMGEIGITYQMAEHDPELDRSLRSMLELAARTCGAGPSKYKVDVRIDLFKRADDATTTTFLGDRIQLAGQVRFISPQTNDVVADYYIDQMRAASGLVGTLMLAKPEITLSRAFAGDICSSILKREPPAELIAHPEGKRDTTR